MQVQACQKVKERSTGPRTHRGKRKSSKNALSHGVFSQPTLPGENRKPWQQFRDAIYRDISPVGAVEESLTGMLALQIWRYRRIASYETAVSSQKLSAMDLGNSKVLETKQMLEREVADWKKTLECWQSDKRLFALVDQDDHVGVSADEVHHFFESFGTLFDCYVIDTFDEELLAFVGATPPSPETKQDEYDQTDWKVLHLKKGTEYIASLAQHSPAAALGRVRAEVDKQINKASTQLAHLRKRLADLEVENQEMLDRAYALYGLPEDEQLQRINRYSTSLQRQVLSTLHELQRLQAGRLNGTTTVPIAIDVTVNGETSNQNADTLLANAQPFSLQRQPKQIQSLQPIGC